MSKKGYCDTPLITAEDFAADFIWKQFMEPRYDIDHRPVAAMSRAEMVKQLAHQLREYEKSKRGNGND
jgi:hypothetical protein